MTEEKLVPELRFPEFKGEWEKKRLGENIKIYSGDSPSKVEFIKDGIPYYKVDDLNNYEKNMINSNLLISEEKINYLPANNILFPKRGASILTNKIRINKQDCYFDTNLMGVEIIEDSFDIIFLHSVLLEKKLYRIADTSTIPQLNNSHINELRLNVPIKKEQEKIGNFFSKIDKKIELQEELIEKLEEQKKGLMQKIFNQEVRFKDENGKDYPEWKEEKIKNMGTLLTSSVNKKIEKDEKIVNLYNYMDVYNKKHIDKINLNALEKTSATDHQIKTNNLLKGDILITPSSETPEDIGHSIVIWEDLPNTLYSYHLLRFRPKIKMDLTFSNYWFNNERVRKKIITRSQGATRYTISIKNLEDIKVNYPVIGEQIKIGNILSLADKKIDLAKEELENYKEYKKGLMQRMFI